MSGPVTGPFIGASDHSDMVRARYSSDEMSVSVPGALLTMQAPKNALYKSQLIRSHKRQGKPIVTRRRTYPTKRTIIISSSDVANPHGITMIVNSIMEIT